MVPDYLFDLTLIFSGQLQLMCLSILGQQLLASDKPGSQLHTIYGNHIQFKYS